MTYQFNKPRWMRDLVRFLPLKSQFVLSGNIRDLQACEVAPQRSEERRVGKEWRSRGAPNHHNKKVRREIWKSETTEIHTLRM